MPIYYDFEEWELTDEDVERFGLWLCNYKETVPPWKPLNLYQWQIMCQHGLEYGPEMLSVPGSRGWGLRQKDGYQYVTVYLATEEEKKQREPVFREKMAPWIDDFAGGYNKCLAEMKERCEGHKQVNVAALSDIELVQEWERSWQTLHRMWELHMAGGLFPGYIIYGLFIDQLGELFGINDMDPRINTLLTGFDTRLYQVVEGQWLLAEKAIKLGLGGSFEKLAEEELLATLEQNDVGRKWLAEFRPFVQEHGWRNERRNDISTPTWIEKPSLALRGIKMAVSQEGIFTLKAERKRTAKKRDEVEKDLLSRVPLERREVFQKLIRGAQQCGWWSEDHNYWFDEYAHAVVRRVTLEMGKRFAQSGVIDDPEDIYFLLPDDIMKASLARFRSPMRRVVERRRKTFEENLKIEPKPFYGSFDMLGAWVTNDQAFRVIASPPQVKEELKADLFGAGGAPGVAEGTARVIMSVDRIAELQPGEILVTPTTTAPWTPVFGVAAAVITEAGGNLAHAVIVAREYGIPAVAGAMEATKKIQTGQRIRVDGNNCAVFILG